MECLGSNRISVVVNNHYLNGPVIRFLTCNTRTLELMNKIRESYKPCNFRSPPNVHLLNIPFALLIISDYTLFRNIITGLTCNISRYYGLIARTGARAQSPIL